MRWQPGGLSLDLSQTGMAVTPALRKLSTQRIHDARALEGVFGRLASLRAAARKNGATEEMVTAKRR